MIALLREQDSVVYCLNNNALFDEINDKEIVLYDFSNPKNMESLKPYSGDGNYMMDSISAGNHMLKRFKIFVTDYLVEGIGYDSQSSGDLLFPFKPMITGVQATGYGINWFSDDVYLWYVKENGNIIYYGQNYVPAGITDIQAASQQPADDAYFNLQGQRVDAARLTPGIYIHNHRKVIVK